MNCQEVEKQIVLFTELTSEQKAKVNNHLSTCKSCSVLFESTTHTNNLVLKAAKVEMEIKDPFRLTNDIMARIKEEESKHWSFLNVSFFKLEFTYVKYTMAAFSFLLIVFFGVEQLQSQAIREVASTHSLKKVVLNRKTFQDELSKSKAAVGLLLANSCKSPFNITKVNEDCLKQRMAIYKEL
jgi:hypothetical protein